MALDEIRKTKIEKVQKLREAGVDPYPAVSGRTDKISEILENWNEESYKSNKQGIVLAGRVMARREHGGSIFLDIHDESGKIQVYVKKDVIGEKDFKVFNELIDIGDFIEVGGLLFTPFTTKRGEKSIEVREGEWKLLTKALLPLPEKWHGLEDAEERLRKRYLGLIMNPEEKELFIKKSDFWRATREFLLKEGGLEVETPVLEQIPGGADAEPFKTYMNALDIDLYLRIAPELHLKRLIVGGFDKIFEIGRIFRNEGIDREHLQDYTQMEMYWAYTDYEKLMELVERLIKYVIKETLGTLSHEYLGKNVNWDGKWKRYD